MKRILATSALALTLATGAHASNANLDASISNGLAELGYKVDVSRLSDSEKSELILILDGSETGPAERRQQIEEIIAIDAGVPATNANLDDSIRNGLAELGFDTDVSIFTASEKAELQLVLEGTESGPGERRQQVGEIIETAGTTEFNPVAIEQVAGMELNSMRDYVANRVDQLGIDAPVSVLDDEQVAELFFAISSSADDSDARAKAEAVFADIG